MSDARKGRWSRPGIVLGLVYLFLVVAVYALTASQPADDGLEWLPFMWLSAPWCWLGDGTGNIFWFVPGFMANALLFYFLGAFIEGILRSRAGKGEQE
jgi:hypothetical protein